MGDETMTVEAKLKMGEDFFRAGQQAEAERAFKEILDLEPDYLRALNNLAVITMADGRLKEAGAYLDQALAKAPHDTHTLDNRLRHRILEKNWPAALAVAETILEMRPNDPGTLRLVAKAALAIEKYELATEKLEKLICGPLSTAEDLENLAYIKFKCGDKAGATVVLAELLKKKPEREDLAVRLAQLKNPNATSKRDLWPSPVQNSTQTLAAIYRKTWGEIHCQAPALEAARLLSHLHDPASLTHRDLPLSQSPSPFGERPQIPTYLADVSGLSIMFAPTMIAGQSPMLARWLKAHKVKTSTVEVSSNYLGYKSDYYYPSKQSDIPVFIDQMLKTAETFDFLCLEFGSSFSYMPNFLNRQGLINHSTSRNPYEELRRLKDKGVKIIFQFWGSDFTNQSISPYVYLSHLGFSGLPKPPAQTRFQYRNIMAANDLADIFLAVEYGLENLPRYMPFIDVSIEPDHWPLKKTRRRLEKILTAPTSVRKKNYSLILSALNSFTKNHPHASAFRVQNTPNDQVPKLYSEADLGIDQVTVGFGILSLEMMALGMPVICYQPPVGGVRSLAPVLSFNNIRELEGRLEECAADSDRLQELGLRGRDYVMENYTIDVRGSFFSQMMAEAAAGSKPKHLVFPDYNKNSLIWEADPEKVYSFRFYDVAVPLFCALGEFEYALFLCLDAIDCGHRIEKFSAWFQAVQEATGMMVSFHWKVPNTQTLNSARQRYGRLLKNAGDLLEEYAEQLAEARSMPDNAMRWFEKGHGWLSD
jgi:Tfp pilus assembly protein PilF